MKLDVAVQTDICEMLWASSSNSSATISRTSSTPDLLAAWEDLLGWSENAATARKMQEEMIILRHALNRLGNKASFELLDTEPSIQIAIEALKNEKAQLQTYRTNMLRLNASVHSWLTRQERRIQNALVEQQLSEVAAKVNDELIVEEKEEAESEQIQDDHDHGHRRRQLVDQKKEEEETETEKHSPLISVINSDGDQMVETHTGENGGGGATSTNVATSTETESALTPSSAEKNLNLQILISSENEFHKHLKDEVSDMYSSWDEADARINTQLEVLTSSLIAWRQLEYGLSEFQQALGQDRGTLKGLEGVLTKGQATPTELAQNVKLVAKLLSERVDVSQEQLTAIQEHLDPNHILHIAKLTASNGSLSDSGISDGGTTSDGSLSERERRLGVLRRLAKQLESALAPGSEAMKSIAARMESAEAELKNLQNTCRDLIVRTAATHQSLKQQQQQQQQQQQNREETTDNKILANGSIKANGHAVAGIGGSSTAVHHSEGSGEQQQGSSVSSVSSKRGRRRPRRSTAGGLSATTKGNGNASVLSMGPGGEDPPNDPSVSCNLDSSDDEPSVSKRSWAWRIARVAVPMQLALLTVFCAACLLQPNCCDNLNNFSMSFTPHLRYVRGPPPI